MLQVTVYKTLIGAGVLLLLAGCVSTSGESRTPRRTGAGSSTSVEDLRRILEGRGGESRRAPRREPRYGTTAQFVIPVAGVRHHDLRDSFGDPRSGGRSHEGIDIMAPRWSEAVAAVEGRIEAITTGARSGKALWIAGADGRSYFYAHLEAWAEGLRRGMRVRPGDLVGYVGNSGNAVDTPPHLHFEIRDRRGVVNPYDELVNARPLDHSEVRVADASRTPSGRRSIWETIFGG